MRNSFLSVLATVHLAETQQPKKVRRIGYQLGSSFDDREEALRQGLRDLGYVERQNIIIVWCFAVGQELYRATWRRLNCQFPSQC